MHKKKFITGNEAVVEAALSAGAVFMSGYPITPSTEILELWAKNAQENKNLKFIQSEDETSAGFNVIGALLAGVKAFTATAGPGHVLMQDPISMAEAMRLPFVGIIMQRGGPSTGTVIYSQQEITLACFGGNGEGQRIVYSASNPQDLYNLTQKAFYSAWKYRFPCLVLGDGYQAKMMTQVELIDDKKYKIEAKPIIDDKNQNMRNCFNFEKELASNLIKNQKQYLNMIPSIVESESYKIEGAEKVIVAHGIIANAARQAVDVLRNKNKKIGLFRPITLRPLDFTTLSRVAANTQELLIVESSFGQFERIIKSGLYGLVKIKTIQKPAESISPEEIIQAL